MWFTKGSERILLGASEVTLNLLPKIKVVLIVKDKDLDNIIDVIAKAAKTGEIGDGKIFVYNVEKVQRIQTGETGEEAI